jgi:DNA-binding FadR family transcriptional regulator
LPFEALAPQRLYEQVAEQIARLIGRGEFQQGDRLPPERDLAVKLGVSRPTVREAMIALEIAGLVEVRTGAGTYVTGAPSEERPLARFLRDAGPGPVEVVQARRLIEPPIAAAAARRGTDAQLQAIAETVGMMRAAQDSAAHRASDRLFHNRVAEAGGNGIVVSIVDNLWETMVSPMFERMGRLTGLIPHVHGDTTREHGAIVAALMRRDADAAAQAMDDHLATVERILSGEGERDMPASAAAAETTS